MNQPTSFDRYLELRLTGHVPGMGTYCRMLAEFHEWVLSEVDAQANYTDRYAPPALETFDRNGTVVNRIVAFALLCEAAGEALPNGSPAQAHSAWRYLEELEPRRLGAEDDDARQSVLELLRNERLQATKGI
jgi:hypothetical protein